MSLVQEGSKKSDKPQKEEHPINEAVILVLKIVNNMMLVQNQTLRAEVEIQALSNIAKARTLQK